MKNIFKRKFRKKKKSKTAMSATAAKSVSTDDAPPVITLKMNTFKKNVLDDNEQVFACSLQPAGGVMELRKTSVLDWEEVGDDDDGYSTTTTTVTQVSSTAAEASNRSINVVTVGETPLDVFLQSFRRSGSEFVSSAYLMERSIDTYSGSLSTSLPEDVFTLVDTQVCLLNEYLQSSGLARTATGDAVVVDALLNIFRILQVKQKHYSGSFLRDVDSCIASANDFLRMADKTEQLLDELRDNYPHLSWNLGNSNKTCEWTVSMELVEQEASNLMDLYQQDAVMAAKRSSLCITESIQQSDISSQLFSYAWEEELTHNQVARAIVRTYAEMLANLEPLIATEYLYHKLVTTLVRSTVCFYIQCFVVKANKARKRLEDLTRRDKTKHFFTNPSRALMRMTHDTKVFEEFFLDVAGENVTLRRIMSNELSLLRVIVLECMAYATGQNGSDSLEEFILVLHNRTGADFDVTRHFLSDIYVLMGSQKKQYLSVESKVRSMKAELDNMTCRVEEKRSSSILAADDNNDTNFRLDKMLRKVYEDKILHEKLALCGNLMADVKVAS